MGDYYRGLLTLRQILVRIRAMPPVSPLAALFDQMREDDARAEEDRKTDAALEPFERIRRGEV